MIKPICVKCRTELTEFGALMLSPPEHGAVDKMHICVSCWQSLLKFLTAPQPEEEESDRCIHCGRVGNDRLSECYLFLD